MSKLDITLRANASTAETVYYLSPAIIIPQRIGI